LKPPSIPISIQLETNENKRKFNLFSQKSVTSEKNGYVTMNLPDLITFLSKYKKIHANPTLTIRKNTESPTLVEYDSLLTTIGFKKEIVKTYPYPKNLIPVGVEFDTELPDTYIMYTGNPSFSSPIDDRIGDR